MYTSLPFDDPATVAGHSEGVLRRIKDPDNKKALDAWLSPLLVQGLHHRDPLLADGGEGAAD